MALIKCNEWWKEFSDKANACPNCACPIERKKTNITNKKSYNELTSTEKQKVMSYRKLNKEFWIGTRPIFLALIIWGLIFVMIGLIFNMLFIYLAFIPMIIAYIIYCFVLPNETIKWYEENKNILYDKEILK